MNRRRVLIAGLTALFVGGAAHAQSVRPQPASFRVEWERRTGMLRPAIEGYVYNDSEYRIGNVLLRIEILDVSGRRVSGKTAWVYGVIDAYGRGYFLLPVPEAGQTYQIAVESFDVLSRQMP
jgi:hypothetical protein